MLPLSNELSFAVTVCVFCPWLVQVTVVPSGTVMSAGLKVLSVIVTVDCWVPVAVVLVVVLEAVPVPASLLAVVLPEVELVVDCCVLEPVLFPVSAVEVAVPVKFEALPVPVVLSVVVVAVDCCVLVDVSPEVVVWANAFGPAVSIMSAARPAKLPIRIKRCIRSPFKING